MNRINGFTTLAVTLMLLSILVAVSVFVGKVLISEKRITLNEIEYRVAFSAAEKGVTEAMVKMNVEFEDITSSLPTTFSDSYDTEQGVVSYTVTIDDNGINDVFDVLSVSSIDGRAGSQVNVQAARRSVFSPDSSGPASPIMATGGMTLTGSINIGANPNGGGPGVPVSLWSRDPDVDGTGSFKSCHLGGFVGGNCAGDIISDKTNLRHDIIYDDDAFPTRDELFEAVFGYPDNEDGWAQMEKMATAIVDDCKDVYAPGFFIVEGEGECSFNDNNAKTLGSETEPVLVIVKDRSITTNANFTMYGVVFAYTSTDLDVLNLKFNGTAAIYGGMITNHSNVDLPTGTFGVAYNEKVLCALTGCEDSSGGGGNPFVRISYVPGSWKDWE